MASNATILLMKRKDVPLTVENYRFFAWMGDPPETMSAEEASELPEELIDHPNKKPPAD
jgi:hypothetical protein